MITGVFAVKLLKSGRRSMLLNRKYPGLGLHQEMDCAVAPAREVRSLLVCVGEGGGLRRGMRWLPEGLAAMGAQF